MSLNATFLLRKGATTRLQRTPLLPMGLAGVLLSLAFLTVAINRNAEEARMQSGVAQHWHAHTLDVLLAAESLDTALNQSLRGERGFILTANPEFLTAYFDGRRESELLIQRLNALTRDNQSQQHRLKQLASATSGYFRILERVLRSATQGGRQAAVDIIRTGHGRVAAEQVRGILQEVKDEERRLLQIREAANSATALRTQHFGEFLSLLNWVFLGAAAALSLAVLRARQQARKSAASLSEGHRLLSMAASLSRIGYWRVDVLERKVVWSTEVFGIYGLPEDHQPTLENAVEPYHPDDRDEVSACVARALEQGDPFAFTKRLLHPNGEVRTVAVHGQTERSATGSATGVFGVIQDITEQVVAEARYRLLAENASDVILRTDVDGAVVYVSPSCLDLSGFEPPELVGRRSADFIHADDLESVHAAHVRIVTEAAPSQVVEYRFAHKDGGWRWLESHMKPWRTPDGSDGVISAIRNIDARKALEADLIAARDAAETAVRAKAAFLANMSHEIRTPLNGVLGFAELLTTADLPPEQSRHATIIVESGRALLKLLNDILDVSKIDAGQIEVENQAYDVGHTLRQCARLMSPQAEAKKLALDVDLDPELPRYIRGDGLRVRQVVLNLLGNAVKFTDTGRISLQAVLTRNAAGPRLMVRVSDTGIGIPEGRRTAVFEAFVQGDVATARKFGGTGLGLSISRRLVELMGGSLELESVEGLGTLVTMLLPLTEAAAEPTIGKEGTLTAPIDLSSRVLVVDDVDINRELVFTFLTAAGYETVCASSGEEALALIGAAPNRFDLVLMDVQMPGLDGHEATRRIRSLGGRCAKLPIIALTANAFEAEIDACRAVGMDAHLPKPVARAELLGMVNRWLARSSDISSIPEEPLIEEELLEQFRARKADYARRLAELQTKLSRANGEASKTFVEEVRRICHQLAGTAGMFGEAELGEVAYRVEELGARSGPDGEPHTFTGSGHLGMLIDMLSPLASETKVAT